MTSTRISGHAPQTTRRFSALALAALLSGLCGTATAVPTLGTHFTQSTYDVDVRPGSDFLTYHPFSGVGVTSYMTPAGVAGDGVFLQAFSGQFVTSTQHLKLHFTAHAGYTFTSIDFSHLLSYFQDRGGHRTQMSWLLDNGDGTPLAGSLPLFEDFVWSHGGSYSDFTQAAPLLPVGNNWFDLDVTLFYAAAGAADPPLTVPEPSSMALALAAFGAAGCVRRRGGRSRAGRDGGFNP